MKIGILQTGHLSEVLQKAHGNFDRLFEVYLQGRGFGFDTYCVVDGIFPASPHDAQGWLITGSKHAVYEDHPWIAPLEDFLRAAYDAAVPIVGVCFGHQILAQALGGKVVKFSGGWCVGPKEYQSPLPVSSFGRQCLIAWHQDQVVVPPADAEVIGTSDCCANAMLRYGNKALGIQPHPEFTTDFTRDLLDGRRATLPERVGAEVEATLGKTLTSSDFARFIEDFFKNGQR